MALFTLDRGEKVTRLEAFVDAAFAFSVTLLVISGDRIPSSVDQLIQALKQLPAYAASFLLIMSFWSSHVRWSQRYGLDDAFARRLSLLLVFLVLIFVYPLKMVFASFFNAMTGGYLPTNFAVNQYTDIPAMFITFAIAFGSMGAVMVILYWHAWRQRVALKLSYNEIQETKISMVRWLWVPVFALISFVLAVLIPPTPESGWWVGLPGFIYFGQNILQPLTRIYLRKHWIRAE
jgi:uncharacterized membrane protein